MKRKRVVSLLIVAIMMVSVLFTGCQKQKDRDTNHQDSDPEEIIKHDELPVYAALENPDEEGFFTGIYIDPNQQTVEAYQQIRDCGVRTVCIDPWNGTRLNSTGLSKALEVCETVGLDAYIQLPNSVNSVPEDYVSFVDSATVDYTQYPAFKGVYVFDEPRITQMDWIAEELEKWKNSKYKDHTFLVNMMRHDTINGYEPKEFAQAYWDKVLSKNDDNIFLYDYYPLYASVGDKVLPYIREDVLSSMEAFAQAVKEHSSKFYVFLQTYAEKDGTARANVSVNDVRFQCAYNLAYGAQGFLCFTYGAMNQFADAAMITSAGEKKDNYYYVQEVFSELKNWENVYFAFDWQGIMSVLGTERGYGAQDPSHITGLTCSMESHDRIAAIETEYDLLTGVFKDQNDNDGFLITSYTDPYYMKDNEIKVTFHEASRALVYYNGKLLTNDEGNTCYVLTDGALEFDLEAGDYLFVIPVK